jgi:hypothetical protein
MDVRRNAILAEIAREAAIERSDFLVRAGDQLDRFLSSHRDRIRDLGGLVLIDDDPDYLAIAPDGTFRSRSRVYDEATGEWDSETEIVETAAELVELYNPADIFEAFEDAVDRAEAGADVHAPDAGSEAVDPYAGAADSWAAGEAGGEPTDETSAARALYDLALDYQDRSQRTEAGLLDQFEQAAAGVLGQVGTLVILDEDDEHLALGPGGFRARVIPEGDGRWVDLSSPDELVRYYDPTDVFGDLAEALAEAYPDVVEDDEGR